VDRCMSCSIACHWCLANGSSSCGIIDSTNRARQILGSVTWSRNLGFHVKCLHHLTPPDRIHASSIPPRPYFPFATCRKAEYEVSDVLIAG
jgi:hypothetical protein